MSQDIITDLENLYSAVVADVLDSLGYTTQTLSPAVRALTPAGKIAGRIFTLKAEVVTAIPEEPYKLEMEAIDAAESGDVLVVDAGHDTTCAFWGELLTTACMAKGVRGTVMTGCTRDVWALNKLDLSTVSQRSRATTFSVTTMASSLFLRKLRAKPSPQRKRKSQGKTR